MTGRAYLVDSDVLVDVIRNVRRIVVRDNDRASISILTRAELFAGSQDDEWLRRFLAPYDELPLTPAIAERAGRIRRRHGLAIPDAVIAATALDSEQPLMTRNVRHFGQVDELRLGDLDDLAQ